MRRIGGRLRAGTKSVNKITTYVRKTNKFRYGSSAGRANAAANETIPRIPVQASTVIACQGGAGSALEIDRETHRGIYVAGKTQAKRTRTTVMLIIVP